MPEEYGKSRRKKKKGKRLFAFLLILVLIALAGAVFLTPVIKEKLPNSEYKDLNEWFEVSGSEVKLYLDNEVQTDYTAVCKDGEAYLPFEYVYGSINGRFYYNEAEKLLSYTLASGTLDFESEDTVERAPAAAVSGDMPETAVEDDADNMSGTEVKAFIEGEDGSVYLALSLVQKYTDISHAAFISDTETAKRAYIWKGGLEAVRKTVKRNSKVRTAADKKAPILTDIKKGEAVAVTEETDEWSRVVTDSGFVGYIKTSRLKGGEKFIYPDTYTEEEFEYASSDEKIVMGWQAVFNSDANNNFDSLYDNTGGTINVISPQWLQISSAEGDLKDYSDKEYIEKAHSLGLEVWPSVDNVNQPGGLSDFSTGDFFADTVNRRSFIAKLMDKALGYGYDGINLDFEGIPASAGRAYTQFFRELSVECHKNGIALSIDNYVPYSYNDHYNLEEQAFFADYVVIMGYDEHTGSDIGPVASISYAEYGITEALNRGVPKERLILGVPLYTRVWRTNDGVTTSESLGISRAEQYVSDNAIALNWDDEAGSYYGETMIGTGQIQIWLEENESLKLKTDKIKEYGLAGLAVWRLGLEPADVWTVLDLN